MTGKPRLRAIDGRQFVEVDRSIERQGKYREDKVHHEMWDGRRWALVEDMVRLGVAIVGNRG